jgi:hypothetical protein
MNRRAITLAIVATLLVGAFGAGSVQADGGGKPVRTSDSYTVTFIDDFILETCGIETETTLTESWTLLEYPNGKTALKVKRIFVPADPRIPIEKGHGMTITKPDGSRIVIGVPLHLISQITGRTLIKDRGLVKFDPDGKVVRVVGPHPSLGIDLTPYYCPGPPD